jgi:hypothetical protein
MVAKRFWQRTPLGQSNFLTSRIPTVPTNHEIAEHFRSHGLPKRAAEQSWYGEPGSLAVIVARAITSEDAQGKVNRHQRRNGREALAVAKEALLGSLPALCRCTSFETLHAHVAQVIGHIDRIGALAIYDCAQRICVARKLVEPEAIYLHAGTADGAATRDVFGRVVSKVQFPEEFQQFSSFELEDLLCNYKRYLAGEELPNGPLP